MKPKISTGYLTPQAKKKKHERDRLSDKKKNASEAGIDENIFASLMKCPEKKKLILELLAANKDAIKKYKEKESKNSPLAKVKNKKKACESPTALLRRRALEQMNSSPSTTTRSSSSRSELSRSSSRCSEVSSNHSSSSVSFDKVLDGVVAFVEIKNKDQDRSSGAKAILESMGAKIREKFTNDVTHVIFKDGSFMTYQKSKLMKIHLVSILWVEFCRKTMKRQPEKQYPALSSGFQDNETSMICSQMQKEYEDIIRDEYRKSIREGTPLPSTRSLIDRRRTLMTPSVSNLNSTESFHTATEGLSSQECADREVAAINSFNSASQDVYEESLILNDPDCFSDGSGAIINGNSVEKRGKRNSVSKCILKSVENVDSFASGLAENDTSKSFRSNNASQQQQSIIDSDMELTMILNPHKTPKAKASINDIYHQKTPKLPSQKIPTNLFDRRKTICNSFLSSDTSTAHLMSSDKSKTVSSLLSSDKSTNISDNVSFAVPKSVKKSKRSSSLFGSTESLVFGKNKAKSSKMSRVELDKTASAMSELNLSSDKDTSKRYSVVLHKSSGAKGSEESKSRSSSLSRLWLSSERKSNEKAERSTSMSDLHLSSETSNKNKEPPAAAATSLVIKSSIPISSEDNKKSADESSMSTLQISTESKKPSRKRSSKNKINDTLKSDPSLMSSLNLSPEKTPKTYLSNKNKEPLSAEGSLGTVKMAVKSSMSTLQISSESKRSSGRSSSKNNKNNTLNSDPSLMSSLNLSTEKAPKTYLSNKNKEPLSAEGSLGKAKMVDKSSMSTLQISSESKRSSGRSSSKNNKNNTLNSDPSFMSSLNLSTEKAPKTYLSNKNKEPLSAEGSLGKAKMVDKSSMSTLQISSESKRSSGRSSNKNNKNNTLNSDPSMMSSLHLSSEKMPPISVKHFKEKLSTNTSFSPLNNDSGSFKDLVQSVIESLNTPDPFAARKKSDQSSASLSRASIDSDESEILSPRKYVGKTMRRQTLGESNNLEDSSCASDNLCKQRERELLSTVTKRKKSLGSRRSLFRTRKESPIDKDKVLVVNIIKSPLHKLRSDKESLESTKSTLLKSTGVSKTTQDSNNTNNNSNKKSKNCKKHTSSHKNDNRNNISSNTSTESDIDRASNSKTKSDESTDSTTSRKKLRRLYNPDDSIPVLIDDEKERQEKRLAMRKRKSNESVFINPAEVLKSSETRLKNSSPNESIESDSSDGAESPLKRTEKGKRKGLKVTSLNSSADEQKDLLNEVINKKNKIEVIPKTPRTPRSVTKSNSKGKGKTPKVQTTAETPSRRKSTRIIKPSQKLVESQKRVAKNDVPITPRNRRSTLDFQPMSSSKKLKKVDKVKLPTIVCTKLHKSDVQMFTQIIKKLGRFIVEDEVTSRTTHLVAGESKRTINMLRAVSRGCWVLKFDWVLRSLEAGKWLREEDFEVHDFSPAVQKCRLERQAFGSTFTLDVFEYCPPIYVATNTNPRCSDLKELITTCRGKVVTAPRMAKIIVGDIFVQDDTVCVNETWVLDCITFNKKMAFKKQYLLDKEKCNKRKSVVL